MINLPALRTFVAEMDGDEAVIAKADLAAIVDELARARADLAQARSGQVFGDIRTSMLEKRR